MRIRWSRPGAPSHSLPGAGRLAVAAAALLAVVLAVAGAGAPGVLAAVSTPGASGTLMARSLPVRPASSQPPVQPGQTRWTVHPSTPNVLDARPDFNYTGVEPGAQISDYVAVVNESLHAQVFAVYASDAYITSGGAYDLLPAGERPTEVGAWIRLAKSAVNLKAGQQAIIPFTLTVPGNVAPGDYSGGIVAQITVAGKGGIKVDERVGARVYVRVAGKLTPSLGVTSLLTSYHGTANPAGGGTATVTYTVTNTGNVRLGYDQQVTVSGWFGASSTVHPRGLAQLLPGNSIQVRTTVPGVWPAGALTATVKLTAIAVPGSTTPPVPLTDKSSSLFEFPWPQLVALIVLILLGLAVWLGLRWRRSRLVSLLAAAEERGKRAESWDRAAASETTPETPR
jgi:hypothetical protein